MKIHIINSGLFKLDGGAMFGIVPKVMWQKLNPPDENNLCTWTMRCLLIETATRKILVDTAMGNKQDAKFRSHFHPHGDDTLLSSLANINVDPEDITDVFLTHLHFDHVGGAVKYNEKMELVPTFPNATYWSNQKQWDWAMNPNYKEKASFLKENFVPLLNHQVIKFIDTPEKSSIFDWIDGIKIQMANGHTEAMMLLHIPINGKEVIYCADLLPSSFHIGMPYVMSYDIRPLVTLQEKKFLFDHAIKNDALLVFEHDPANVGGKLKITDRGRVALDGIMTIDEFLSK